MSRAELVRPIIVGLPGTELDTATRSIIEQLKPAGFILFARNCENPAQLSNFTAELKKLLPAPPLLFIDHEGGRVQRFQWDDYIPPAARVFGEIWRQEPELGLEAARLNGLLLGWQVARFGLTVNCAPVADLAIAGADEVIGERAFSEDPQAVGALAGATMAGLMRGGVWPVLKHAPGHGRARADSHKSLPVIDTPLQQLQVTDFITFKALAQAPLVMTAHVALPAITGADPITFSQAGINFLCQELGLQGLLVADDLWMGALTGSLLERAEQALAAGCDLLLVGSGRLDGQFDAARWQELTELEQLPLVNYNKLNRLVDIDSPAEATIQQAKQRLHEIFLQIGLAEQAFSD
jgi:beta-N-acetylhexosaminidase